jgi:predicted site-specific integrase-resolvase
VNSTGLEGAGVSTRHLNQNQLAERLNISPRTLERWRWLGEGPPFLKIGGRVVYRLEDIERYEADKLRGSTTAPTPMQPA